MHMNPHPCISKFSLSPEQMADRKQVEQALLYAENASYRHPEYTVRKLAKMALSRLQTHLRNPNP